MKTPKRIINTALAVTRAIGSPASIAIHTIIFIAAFLLAYTEFITFDRMLLLLTTIVSLEAIYLSLFIQMTINYTTESLEEVSEDIEEMQEDIGEIQEDVDELQEDVEDIAEEDEEEKRAEEAEKVRFDDIKRDLQKLIADVEKLRE
ncbi:MAG: hypothetical protein UY63_C0012G0010 [Parcubacteria group bacterium GW2011_GWA2_51_10]|nr:MAG: hypothetical protein UY63_C0012G0010 [Parcubacteria group bacterium GW2011_GWA2_51_10]